MIALIFVGNIEYCPYVNNYIKYFEDNSIEFALYYWNRESLKKGKYDNYYAFDYPSNITRNKRKKLAAFWKYACWIRKKIDENNYEKLIFLDTLSAFLLYTSLGKYKKKYIFEIRDYSYEKIFIFKAIEKYIVANSFQTFISSPGFKKFLPKGDYMVCHNISHLEENNYFPKNRNNKIVLVWAGTVRYFDTQIRIISQLKNDRQFEIYYHGSGYQLENLIHYCRQNSINNVHFTGRYEETEKMKLMEKADFILNAYDLNIGNEVKYAISNRFYDALVLSCPQIVENNSYKAYIVKKYNLGVIVNDNLKESILNYYTKNNIEKFKENCNLLLKKCVRDNERVMKRIDEFCNKIH